MRWESVFFWFSTLFLTRRRSLVPTEYSIQSNFHPFNGSKIHCPPCESETNVHQFVSILCIPEFIIFFSFRDFRCAFFHSFLISMNDMMHKRRDTCADGPLLHKHMSWWRYSIEMEWETRMKLKNTTNAWVQWEMRQIDIEWPIEATSSVICGNASADKHCIKFRSGVAQCGK